MTGLKSSVTALLALMLLAFVLLAVALWFYGRSHWHGLSAGLLQRVEAARKAPSPARFDARELDDLPPVVQRWFRAVLRDGTPMVSALSIEHRGTFNMSESGERWSPFTSRQRVVTTRPGFVWDARITMLPGLDVHVHDAYVAGEGLLHPALLGLISLADLRDSGDMARGELMRFFAEAAWYPTALLPSQGVRWQAVDDHSARATLRDGAHEVTLLFVFDDEGLMVACRAEARGRTSGGKLVPTPWQGRWSAYEWRDGMRVPMRGEVAWLLPDGPRPYWRGEVTALRYEFAAP